MRKLHRKSDIPIEPISSIHYRPREFWTWGKRLLPLQLRELVKVLVDLSEDINVSVDPSPSPQKKS